MIKVYRYEFGRKKYSLQIGTYLLGSKIKLSSSKKNKTQWAVNYKKRLKFDHAKFWDILKIFQYLNENIELSYIRKLGDAGMQKIAMRKNNTRFIIL